MTRVPLGTLFDRSACRGMQTAGNSWIPVGTVGRLDLLRWTGTTFVYLQSIDSCHMTERFFSRG